MRSEYCSPNFTSLITGIIFHRLPLKPCISNLIFFSIHISLMLSAMGHSHIMIRTLSSYLCIMILGESAQLVIKELMKAIYTSGWLWIKYSWEEKQNMHTSSQSPSTFNINSTFPFTDPKIPAITPTSPNKRN